MNVDKSNVIFDSDEFFVQYHITNKCNLNCTHCYQKKYTNVGELSTNDIFCSLKEISEMILDWKHRYLKSLTGMIQLTGGEPLLRFDWEDIVDCCLCHDLKVIILTNGTLLNDKIAQSLAQKNVKVQVSIDGIESTHNMIRENGSYKAAIQGITALLKHDANVSVNMTPMKSNISDIQILIEELKHVGIKRLGISRYVHFDNQDSQLLKKEDLAHFSNYIKQVNTHSDFKIICRDPLFNAQSSNGCDPSGCSIGFWGFAILHDGTLLPCSRLNIPIGNIKDKSVRELWAASPVLWDFRDSTKLKGKCLACKFRDKCRGCRAIAYAFTNDPFSEDPQCWLSA